MRQIIAYALYALALVLEAVGFIGRAYVGKGAIAIVFIGIACAIIASGIGGENERS